MREDLLKEVFLDLEEQQRRNEETEAFRRQEIREKYPEIAALMEKREDLIRETMRGILRGETAPEDLPERMEEVSGKIRDSLREKGYPENYLAPVYTCPICRDTGYTGEQVRERCTCITERYQAKLRRAIGLPEDGRETFESFNESLFSAEKLPGAEFSQREVMRIIRKTCETWADTCPAQQPRDLVLSGKSGLGKTFLLHAMAARLITRGHQVLLISAYSFLETARKSYFENDDRLEELIGTPVLMLDDLGSEPLLQNVTIEQLFNLINERQRRNLPTVISTNLNQEELRTRYTERIASRLTDKRNVQFLVLRGSDVRTGRK